MAIQFKGFIEPFLAQKTRQIERQTNFEWFFVVIKKRLVVIFTWGNKFCFTFCIQVAFELVVNDNLGLMIRGGIEYGLGIYITGVDEESAAFRNGLRVRFSI